MFKKTIRIGCGIFLALLVLAAIGFEIWVSGVTSKYQADVDRICKARQQAFEEAQRLYANDVATNAYCNPTLFPAWCKKSDFKEENEASRVLKSWASLTDGASGGYEQASKLYPAIAALKDDEAFEQTRERFEELLPTLQEALAKPVFLTPATRFDSTIEANFLGIRRVAQGVAFYAKVLMAEKRPQEAVDWCLADLRLGRRVGEPQTMIHVMVGLAVQQLGVGPLSNCLRIPEALDVETLQKVVDEVPRCQFPDDILGQCLETEILLVTNTVRSGGGSGALTLARASGLMERELRLYYNDMYPLVEWALGKGEYINPMEQLKESIEWADLRGEHGILAKTAIPNVTRVSLQIRRLSSELSGLRLVAGLQLYRQQKGKYPAKLVDLKEVGINPLPQNRLAISTFQYKLEKGKPHLLMPVDPEVATQLGLTPDKAKTLDYPVQEGGIVLLP